MPRSFHSSIISLVSFSSFFLFGCDAGSTSSAPSAGSANNGGSPAASGGTSATAGAAATNGGTVGQAGASGVAGASGTAGGASGAAATGGGTAPGGASGNCTGALICDDFEAYTGTPGAPWKVTTTKFGTVAIDGTQHRSGTKAVKFTTTGGLKPDFYQLAYITLENIFPIANNAFYGRMMFYVTKAANNGVHWTMIEGEGAASAQGISNAQVRYGGQQEQHLMANYDSTGKKSDCWQHSATKIPEAQWACMEWYFDGATNTQKFWLDGKAIDDLTVVDEGQGCLDQDTGGKWIYPTFSRLNLGWGSYIQDDPREAWIDDVAIGSVKIGCPE